MERVSFDYPMHVRLSPQLAEQAQRRARENEQTLSEVVRGALRQYLRGEEQAA